MTGPAVGIQTVWGYSAIESSYGTWTTPDRFLDLSTNGGDTVKYVPMIATSSGLRGGTRNYRQGARRVKVGESATGDNGFEVVTNGMGRLFEVIMGGAPTITAGTGGNAAAITQVYPLGSLAGRSVSTQKQLLDAASNHIVTLSRQGCKVMKAVFSVKTPTAGGPGAGVLMLNVTWDCQREVRTTAPASPSFVTTHLLGFAGASILLGGSPVANALDVAITVTNPSDVQRRYIGSGTLKAEPTDQDYPSLEVTATLEILGTTYYDLLLGDTPAAFVATFAGGIVPGASSTLETVQFNVPEIHIIEHPTDVSSYGPIRVPVKLEAAADASSDAANITYITSDVAA